MTNNLVVISKSLEESLVKGWTEFKEGLLFKKYATLHEIQTHIYENNLKGFVPHPAYHLASQRIGKYFMVKSREFGLSFDEIFPGIFEKSEESEIKDIKIRHFILTAYRNNELLGNIHLSFYHCHDKFDFPVPPTLEIQSDTF